MNDTKINTYTDHKEYQEPIIRSKAHNMLRYIVGVVVIVSIGAPLVVGGVSGALFDVYEICVTIISSSYQKQELMLRSIAPFFSFAVAFVGLEFFRWGRHLTRPTSREFI